MDTTTEAENALNLLKTTNPIRYYRLQADKGVPACADELGVTPAAWWNWEALMRSPEQKYHKRIAEIVGVQRSALWPHLYEAEGERDVEPI